MHASCVADILIVMNRLSLHVGAQREKPWASPLKCMKYPVWNLVYNICLDGDVVIIMLIV